MRPEPATSGPTGGKRSTTGTADGSSGEFDVETVDRIGTVDPVEWDAAVEAQRLPVFYSHTFLSAYERYPLAQIDAFAYLLVRRRGEPGPPVAVLPAYLQRRSDPLGCLATVYPEAAGQPALLSHSWHCYDSHLGGPATDPALAAAAVTALRGLARELGAPWCGLVNVRRAGRTARALAGAGLPVRSLMDRFAADLSELTDLEHYLARYARPRAGSNLRRYRRRAAEHGVRSTVLPVEEADLAGVTALCDRVASRYGTDRFYPAGLFERFVAALGPSARVLEIRQQGRLIAAGVCLLDAYSFHAWAGGADYRVDGNFSPYYVMFAETVELALRLRRPIFEGGRGNPDFKQRHGLTARPLDACLVRS
jgi:predicted N-acyltransferase